MRPERFSDDDIAYQTQLIEQAIIDRPLLKLPGGSRMTFVIDKRTGRTTPVALKFAAIKILGGQGTLAQDSDIGAWLQDECAAVFATGAWKKYQ